MNIQNSALKSSDLASAGSKKKRQPNRLCAVLRDDRVMRFSVPLLFFGCFFAFLLFYIDPAVIYSSNGINVHNYVVAMHAQEAFPQRTTFFADPSFRRLFILELTPEYLRDIAGAPGGWTRLAVTLCIYACHYPFAGALVVTALAFFFYWLFPLYIQGLCKIRPVIPGFVPALFILTMCAWYELGYCVFLLPVGGALAFAVLYQRFRPDGVVTRALLLSLFFWSAWYLLWWGCLLVLLFVIVHECFNRERRIAPAVIASAVNSALLFALDAWVIPLAITVRWSDFLAPRGLPLAMIGFFPLAAAVFAVRDRLRHRPEGKVTAIGAIMRLSVVCGGVALVVWLYGDPVNRDTRTIARTVYHIMNEKWEAVLNEKTGPLFADFPQKTGGLKAFMVHAFDHALYRTGRIGSFRL
jgi:hypothetical protein